MLVRIGARTAFVRESIQPEISINRRTPKNLQNCRGRLAACSRCYVFGFNSTRFLLDDLAGMAARAPICESSLFEPLQKEASSWMLLDGIAQSLRLTLRSSSFRVVSRLRMVLLLFCILL